MVIKMEINDGYMPFKGFKTYYRIVDGGDKTPLKCWIVLPRREEK